MDNEDGIVSIKVTEVEVGNLTLQFVNKKTGESKEEGAARREVIMRHVATRPGQVSFLSSFVLLGVDSRSRLGSLCIHSML